MKPICSSDVSNHDELRDAFCWNFLQPLLEKFHQQKGFKYNFQEYQLQFLKAYQFIKLNEEGHNEDFHR